MNRVLPLLLAGTIILASSTSKLATPDLGLSFSPDKLAHFLLFGLLATLILRNPEFLQARWKGALTALALVTLFGAFDEYRQSLTPGRMVEFNDWLADTLGALTAVLAYHCLAPYRKALEWKPFCRRNAERKRPNATP
ncbi:MAG: VanZ family protein [Coraliomargaritaceae bacterium]